jgi:esterase/lipase superfamily enzyme
MRLMGATAAGIGVAVLTMLSALALAQEAPSEPAPNVEAPAETTAVAPAAVTSDRIKAALARELGVPVERLSDSVDLVGDLELDQGVVFYAVRAVIDQFGGRQPTGELTKVGEIVAAAAPAAARPTAMRRYAAAPQTTSYVQAVFYATDRKATGDAKPELAFGGERAAEGQMSYGRADVNIPYSHKPGHIETPWLKLEKLRDASKHIFILKLDSRNEAQFFSDVAGTAEAGDILVYVHGFNVRFEDALVRAAQISFDFGFKGAPIVYSWPSWGSLTAYNSDSENVLWSARHIETFLRTLTEQANGRKIHLVAHSMGSKGLLTALRYLALSGAAEPRFASVILCAPDYDAVLFREQVAAEVRPLAAQWVVYSSNKDIALTASEQLNSAPRLGKPVTYAEGYEIIDASELEVTPWSVPEAHSYYATKQIVLSDMVKVLSGMAADTRGLKQVDEQGGTAWTFDTAAAIAPAETPAPEPAAP